MTDLGSFAPASVLPPNRTPTGQTELGRLTTTDEQRAEAIRWIASALEKKGLLSGRATVEWSRHDPSILEVEVVYETMGGIKIALADRVTEFLPSGAEVPFNETQRYLQLEREIIDLFDKKML